MYEIGSSDSEFNGGGMSGVSFMIPRLTPASNLQSVRSSLVFMNVWNTEKLASLVKKNNNRRQNSGMCVNVLSYEPKQDHEN